MTESEKNRERTIALGPASTSYRLFVVIMSFYAVISWIFIFIIPTSESTESIFLAIDSMLSLVFLYDFLRNVITSRNRLNYLKWGWLDLLSSIPFLPLLRILRVASIIRIRRYLMQVTGKSLLSTLGEKRGESALLSTVVAIFVLVLLASIAILNFEVDAPDGNIDDANDAMWWVWVTMTTVGYGDRVPVTSSGRFIGFILMTAGVAMVGVLTGYLANAFSPKTAKREQQLDDIEREIMEIKRLLMDQQTTVETKEENLTSDE